jgi:Arc/MetJ-type ribon-helix-helix transcriptional regulator
MPTKDDRHQVRTSEDETRHLDDLRVRHNFKSRSETIRYCIQQVIEDEGDMLGSRRHFSRTMNKRIDEAISVTELYGAASFVAITELFSLLLRLLDEDGASQATNPDNMRKELYQAIFDQAVKVESTFKTMHQKIDDIKAEAEKQRRKTRTRKPGQ